MVTDVLKMSTLQHSPPMAFIIFIKRCDSLLHWFLKAGDEQEKIRGQLLVLLG